MQLYHVLLFKYIVTCNNISQIASASSSVKTSGTFSGSKCNGFFSIFSQAAKLELVVDDAAVPKPISYFSHCTYT